MNHYEIIPNPAAESLVIFKEDFDDIAFLFKDILSNETWSALPGGVRDTYIPRASNYPNIYLDANDFRGYKMDTGDYLGEAKQILVNAMIAVEGDSLCNDDNFTICPSVSFALLACLISLKELGVTSVLLEAPTYYATVEQAKVLGLSIYLLPTLATDQYRLTLEHLRLARQSVQGRCALVLTQPRYGTGVNRQAGEILNLRASMQKGDIILIDEAADQTVPAPMGKICLDGDVQIWRVRGLTKGLGLNSARMATIIHPESLRKAFGDIVDYAGGNLDSASLQLMMGIAKDPNFYIAQLTAAQQFVREQWKALSKGLMGLPIRLSPIESGYFATAHIETKVPPSDFMLWRQTFLNMCLKHKMPVVLGSSMYFPYDLTSEIVRINYFTPPENIHNTAYIFSKVLSDTIKSL